METTATTCEACITAPEEYECATCGLTGAQIAEARWTANFWGTIAPEAYVDAV